MIGLNTYIHTGIITDRGIISIANAHIGDRVYEYDTGKMLEIKDIIKSSCTDIFQVTYSDKRIDYRTHDEPLPSKEIKVSALEFNPNIIKDPLYPDPYIAGVLFAYGDFNNKFLSLPLDMGEANNEFAHKYNLDYAQRLDKNTVYFSFNHKPNDLITWEEFFPDYDFYAKSKKITSPPIPNEYIYSSIKDRTQFIMGVFDIGYDKTRFPDFVAIEHWDENRLKIIQRILWSLGIASAIEYDPIYRDAENNIQVYSHNRSYRLRLLGDKSTYPGFFYDIHELEYMIGENSWEKKLNPKWTFKVLKSKKYCRGYMSNIVLERPTWYYTADYLPRLSL